jgi:hypothetical protein
MHVLKIKVPHGMAKSTGQTNNDSENLFGSFGDDYRKVIMMTGV